ncbi:arylamine N-acetyltransferase family protein [Entomohabitans teleogrylli]|uniref:arylamine N-acetyltransferase family protein n=1 Tax=Entomohabitans teleogrylli TaxID=1384589 RepID=UPI00073D1AF3|nr:arylamine N-acetyltransferase [Entomohabitans teleogrylli]
MDFNPAAYFARLNIEPVSGATLDNLRRLHLAHTGAFCFENIDVLLERPIATDDDAVFNKLVRGGRGGYCYELNGLFEQVLRGCGFQVRGLAARVLVMKPATMPPRTHRLMLVTLEGEAWIADVGFGGVTLTAPLRLACREAQPTPHGTYRLVEEGGDYLLLRQHRDEWQTLYRFDLEIQYPADYQAANHYTATWPASHFRHQLKVARQLPDGSTLALLNRRLTFYPRGAEPRSRTLASGAGVYRTLEQEFGLCLADPQWGISEQAFCAMLERIDPSPAD